ncbi:hypothetical protein [Holdemanella porci]|uniref:hypothetical protein n=1 Tax=Holdemanella porci TaxID=2652276 RepID=UPI002942D14B|nr:hypothetical protein [Holdemanella porci]
METKTEKLLGLVIRRTTWQIESINRSLEQEKEDLVKEAQKGNTNYVKQVCARIEQLERDLAIYNSYKYELEGIMKLEEES